MKKHLLYSDVTCKVSEQNEKEDQKLNKHNGRKRKERDVNYIKQTDESVRKACFLRILENIHVIKREYTEKIALELQTEIQRRKKAQNVFLWAYIQFAFSWSDFSIIRVKNALRNHAQHLDSAQCSTPCLS